MANFIILLWYIAAALLRKSYFLMRFRADASRSNERANTGLPPDSKTFEGLMENLIAGGDEAGRPAIRPETGK